MVKANGNNSKIAVPNYSDDVSDTQIVESINPKVTMSDDMVEVLLAHEYGEPIELSSFSTQALLPVACNELVDIAYIGYAFTWENFLDSERFIEETLGRVLVSSSWNAEYDSSSLVHYTHESSDPIMVLLNTIPESAPFKRQFALDQRWLKYNGISETVDDAWKISVSSSKC
ncbi:hypothetical protein ACH5RR_034198 [Cinchona calisaya]|uniref:Uncharacterized protein n=1 Tax=Cinchona calisaya TaxID=153742 RepID=A0ABD2YA66_9GENT